MKDRKPSSPANTSEKSGREYGSEVGVVVTSAHRLIAAEDNSDDAGAGVTHSKNSRDGSSSTEKPKDSMLVEQREDKRRALQENSDASRSVSGVKSSWREREAVKAARRAKKNTRTSQDLEDEL